MTQGFVLRAFYLDGTLAKEQTFSGLPIRIGRNALNDFELTSSTVSSFHARIDYEDGRLWLHDLNSRNGIFTRAPADEESVRVDPERGTELIAAETKIILGHQLWLRLDRAHLPVSQREAARVGAVLGNSEIMDVVQLEQSVPVRMTPMISAGAPRVIEKEAAPPMPAPEPAPAPVPPLQEAAPVDLAPPSEDERLAADTDVRLPQMPEPLPDLAPLPPMAGAAPPLPPLPGADELPGLSPLRPQALPNPPSVAGKNANPALQTAFFQGMNLSLDQLALRGLRELADSLAPGNALNTSGEIARFITKLHDAIEVFCRSFIPLREGYAQFVSAMDLQRAAMLRTMHRSTGYLAVEAAKTPQQVAAALLDCTDKSLDPHKAIEGIFADLMIHQVAVLDGVMQGVRALLDELSPEKIEQRAEGGHFLGVGRHRALWNAYCDRYEQLAEEERAFDHIFGRDFTEAYREYQRRKAGGESP